MTQAAARQSRYHPVDREAAARALVTQAATWKHMFTSVGKRFGIESRSQPGAYHLVDCHSCTCRDWLSGHLCSHIQAVRLYVASVRAERARAA